MSSFPLHSEAGHIDLKLKKKYFDQQIQHKFKMTYASRVAGAQ